ncbi:hypothetical protein L804_01861 [Cryptococcus deuterogattii 2001/935-1]|nr:hypothetical protein L804_01861 [Cryptococcus deuterogattii 2001/935-1]
MDQVHVARNQVNTLLQSIKDFISNTSQSAAYHAPIIDWQHPEPYQQSTITGLKKFLGAVETERNHLEALASSDVPPKELATNLPHLTAVWEEVKRADWPLGCISQVLECSDGSQVKVDVVARGGEEWIKVNTMKESRLMAEFREQDSYCNSDYSDYDSDAPAETPNGQPVYPGLTNSAIEQVTSMIQSARSYPRLPHLPPPKVKYILNRLEEKPEGGYADPRVNGTFEIIRSLGAQLVLASDIRPLPKQLTPPLPRPTSNVLLDLSVVVALCCDSTHFPLPNSQQELEARFRPLQLASDGKLSLAPHVPVTKDLRDQLQWEMQHPLIQEMQERLSLVNGKLEFWVTEEVKSRLPKIVEVIGGENEKRRAQAMFTGFEDFWAGSRWKGSEGVLGNMRVRVISKPDWDLIDLHQIQHSPFRRGFASVCQMMLAIVERQTSASVLPPPPPPPKANKTTSNRSARRPQPGITVASRLPSAHTLRTFLAGIKGSMTVLTNNRGAVGKVIREMGVNEGLAYGVEDVKGEAVVWVVNPSSLSEWRRKEVEAKNKALKERLGLEKGDGPSSEAQSV